MEGGNLVQTATVTGRGGRIRTAALRVAAGLAAGTALLLVFFRLVDLSTVYHRLAHLSAPFVALSGTAFLGAYAIRAIRWRRLLRPYRVRVARAITIYQVATFLNWLLPVQAGELAKSMLLQRSDRVPVSRSLATVSMDKTMDLLPAVAILALVPVAGLRLSGVLWLVLLLVLGALGAVAAVLAFALCRRERTLALLTRPLASSLGGRAREHARPSVVNFVDTLLALLRQPRVLLVATAYTAAAAGLDALSCLFAFRAVGMSVAIPAVLFGCTFLNLTFILPTPPAHVGFTEVMGLLIFSGLLGVNRSAVAAMTLFSHSFDGLMLTCTGLLGLGRMGLSLRGTVRLIRRQEHGP
jgi:uncharacterized protein (TIRG00374 family)